MSYHLIKQPGSGTGIVASGKLLGWFFLFHPVWWNTSKSGIEFVVFALLSSAVLLGGDMSPFALYALAVARLRAPDFSWAVADTGTDEITLVCEEGLISFRWDGVGARPAWRGPLGKWAKKIARYFCDTSCAMNESMRLWKAKQSM